jgi:hypothetical protein
MEEVQEQLLIFLIGDSFSAGDVLLEVETDKAQMDVEAQDDGKMAKITVCSRSLCMEGPFANSPTVRRWKQSSTCGHKNSRNC